jgi:hypothetical protein
MNTDSANTVTPSRPVSEDDIFDYAFHLYVQNEHRNDQRMDNWLEARDCLKACPPASTTHIRLYRQSREREPAKPSLKNLAA